MWKHTDIKMRFLSLLEKLVSLLPEYVVPYMIHLLAHDPDFTKPQEYDQLKDIKEWVFTVDIDVKKKNISIPTLLLLLLTKSVISNIITVCSCICRCLWFMLEVLMTKNENNSHAFLRKMVENIKQTKDAQSPDDAKANEVNAHLYPINVTNKWWDTFRKVIRLVMCNQSHTS